MTAVPCPFCGAEHTTGTYVCPTTNRRLQGLLPVDTNIDDKYRIDGIIGVGGMGVVYRAEQTKIRRQVALKMLLPEYIVYPDLVARVEREAATAGQINHPNVVSIVDLGVTPEHGPYIAMELLHGQELATTVERAGGRLDPAQAVDILRQVLGGLDAAHKKGVIHRDLKPENIFLTQGDDSVRGVKVLDFGISKLRDDSQLNSLTRTGTVMGTPQFMAPEQAAGAKDQDARIDLYAAGAVLYAILCNGLPYEADNYNLLISEILNKPPIQILTRNPALDSRLAAIVMKSIAKKPDQRFASARAMSDALGHWYEIRHTQPARANRTPAGTREPRLGLADSTAPIELRRSVPPRPASIHGPATLVEIDDSLSPDDPAYIDRGEATLVVPVPFPDESLNDTGPVADHGLSANRGAPSVVTTESDLRGQSSRTSSQPPPASSPSSPSLPSLLLESPLDAPPIVLPSAPRPPPTDEAWARLRTGSNSSRYHALNLVEAAPSSGRWWLRILVVLALLAVGGAITRWAILRHRGESGVGIGPMSLVPSLPYSIPSAGSAPVPSTVAGLAAVPRPAAEPQPPVADMPFGEPDDGHRRHHHHDPR